MGTIKHLELSAEDSAALEQGYRNGPSHAYRTRCRMILLKNERRTAVEVARLIGCCEMVVHSWVTRYRTEGLKGLETRPGRGRKPILDGPEDLERVRLAVQDNRQRLGLAKGELEEALGKRFCQRTLVRFVKKTVVAINASENVPPRSRARSFTP